MPGKRGAPFGNKNALGARGGPHPVRHPFAGVSKFKNKTFRAKTGRSGGAYTIGDQVHRQGGVKWGFSGKQYGTSKFHGTLGTRKRFS